MNQVRELAHTADIGFELQAAGLDRLFELAARGLAGSIGAEPASEPTEAPDEEIRLSRPDLDRLLVAWLRELLYRSTTSRTVPLDVRVTVAEREGAFALEAHVGWAPWDGEGPSREIKGVTYHGLRVEERDGTWHAQVVLDV